MSQCAPRPLNPFPFLFMRRKNPTPHTQKRHRRDTLHGRFPFLPLDASPSAGTHCMIGIPTQNNGSFRNGISETAEVSRHEPGAMQTSSLRRTRPRSSGEPHPFLFPLSRDSERSRLIAFVRCGEVQSVRIVLLYPRRSAGEFYVACHAALLEPRTR